MMKANDHEWHKDYAHGSPPFQRLYCKNCREPFQSLREDEKEWVRKTHPAVTTAPCYGIAAVEPPVVAGMSSSTLKDSLAELQRLLLLNKEAMQPERIEQLELLVTQLRSPFWLGLMNGAFGERVDGVITSIEKIVEIEKRLLLHEEGEPCLSDKIHESLGNLSRRPLVLAAIAACL